MILRQPKRLHSRRKPGVGFGLKPPVSLTCALIALAACQSAGPSGAGGVVSVGNRGQPTSDASAQTLLDASSMDASNHGAVGDGEASPLSRPDAQALCGPALCACSDGLDNDGDGLIDSVDPDCVSPFVNDEEPYTGIWNDHRVDSCQGCFFSGNGGAGDDGCRVPFSCLTLGEPATVGGSCSNCVASQKCQNYCQAYVPNGCDCFGCCGAWGGTTVEKHVLLSSTCDINRDDFSGCTECVPSESCLNPCGRCELCPGKTIKDLPADCAGATTTPDGGTSAADAEVGGMATRSCDEGEVQCAAGLPSCIAGYACTYGCCIRSPAH
ncbi:MAG: hypothetical protein JWN04_5686 [Myxococcaceae bacterium]|nr:hypothetical protein [Myxococcaceae bacterium]